MDNYRSNATLKTIGFAKQVKKIVTTNKTSKNQLENSANKCKCYNILTRDKIASQSDDQILKTKIDDNGKMPHMGQALNWHKSTKKINKVFYIRKFSKIQRDCSYLGYIKIHTT